MESGILFIRMRALILTNIKMDLRGLIQSLIHVLLVCLFPLFRCLLGFYSVETMELKPGSYSVELIKTGSY